MRSEPSLHTAHTQPHTTAPSASLLPTSATTCRHAVPSLSTQPTAHLSLVAMVVLCSTARAPSSHTQSICHVKLNQPVLRSMKMLALETSCDETGVALLEQTDQKIIVRADALASQVDIHKETGGVVPNVAAREHAKALPPLLKKVMTETGVTGAEVDAIAVTVGPGLEPALFQGVNLAKELAEKWQKPIVPVSHLEGHVYSALLTPSDEVKHWSTSKVTFPALALIVSGGHTLLVKVAGHLKYEILGSTVDDAAGEAFDKVARLLGLSYPGGPAVSKLAERGNPTAFAFPRPMKNSGDLNFSFSGLKTAVLYKLRELKKIDEQTRANIAASFQAAVVDSLVTKVERAIQQTNPKTLLLAGGVAANTTLRETMQSLATQEKIPLRIAPLALCGDNAVMIGLVGLFARAAGRTVPIEKITPQADLTLW